jgi:hypothetical protein
MPAAGDESPRRQDAKAGEGGIAQNIDASGDIVAPVTRQETEGGRDALTIGRDNVTHHHHYYGPGSGGPGAAGPGASGPGSGGTGSGGPAARPRRKIWGGVPARNPSFTGRAELLQAVRSTLAAGDRVAVQALHGMGGVGKTQLAIEYAHRFANGYDIVWWVNSERPELIAEQIAALGMELGCAQEGAPVNVVQRAVLMTLHELDRWLLIFDNVERPDDVADWLPGGTGHVVITSRAYGWDELAIGIQVDVFSRAESVAILQKRVFGLSDADASLVAGEVGDLPLAVAQAAGYMAYTGIPAREYVSLLHDRPAEILEQGKPWQYPRSLAAATRLSFEQMQAQDPVSAEVVSICAVLAPEPVPAGWFPEAAGKLPGPLGDHARDPVAWRQVIYRLRGSGLVRVDPDGLVMHRLTQAIIGHKLGRSASRMVSLAVHVVTANIPGDPNVPASWPGWARVLPHITALNPGASGSAELRSAAVQAVNYLFQRGDNGAAYTMASCLIAEWSDRIGSDDRLTLLVSNFLAGVLNRMGRNADAREMAEGILARCRRQFGDDDPGTLVAASNLANYLRELGEYTEARRLDEDTLRRFRQVLGDDDPETLRSVSNLGSDLCELGDYGAARDMEADTLARSRRVLGADHLETLRSARNLGADYRGLKEYRAALELDADTLERSRRVLGMDHPHALWAASDVAADLRGLGNFEAARELDEDTLARRRRVQGDDHPRTLLSANNLAADLRGLRDFEAARRLDEDTLARRRRVLGPDHPHTIGSAGNLAADLRALGEES